MFVRNFFTKITPEETGFFAFFTGSVLGTEASFRTYHGETSGYIYWDIEKGSCFKPFLRARTHWVNGEMLMWMGEIYSAENAEYLPASDLSEKDKAFVVHLIHTSSAVLSRAKSKWGKKVEII